MIVGNATDEELTICILPPWGILGVHEEITYKRRPIFSRPPHITCDNHFSGDNVLDYAGLKGFGITQTLRWDRFPTGLKEYYTMKW